MVCDFRTSHSRRLSWSDAPAISLGPLGVVDINVAIINPYVGGLGDMMTMVEPSIWQAMQDIENSDYLPGYRLNAYLVVPRWKKTQINLQVNSWNPHSQPWFMIGQATLRLAGVF